MNIKKFLTVLILGLAVFAVSCSTEDITGTGSENYSGSENSGSENSEGGTTSSQITYRAEAYYYATSGSWTVITLSLPSYTASSSSYAISYYKNYCDSQGWYMYSANIWDNNYNLIDTIKSY